VRLTGGEARARLAAARVARLATAGSDGLPHLVPVTFAVDGERIYIRENPRVALLADHYAEDWDTLWWVRVDGRASIVTDGAALQHPLDMLAERYERYRRDRPAGPVIVIDAERWTGWAGGS